MLNHIEKNIMIDIKEIASVHTPEMAVYSQLTEAELRHSQESALGIFIAESPKVIRMAMSHGYKPLSMLCERKHITGDAAGILAEMSESNEIFTVYTGEREVLTQLTGYKLTRGVLCAMHRRELPELDEICHEARLVGVLQGITDTTNIGSIFRAASAMGVDALVLSDDTCDPLNRRAVRVSMGTVFSIPWTMAADPMSALKRLGFKTAALALRHDNLTLDDPTLKQCDRLAVVFGTEGDGLPEECISKADYVVKIPMHHGVDSLNVASAAAVTFWELRRF